MSTFTAEPGNRLGGRYRLEDRMNSSTGWSTWKAIDETLARAVTVLTFAPGFPRIAEVVTAARAASRLTDARLAQVFDVEEEWDHAYVVMEWVGGDCLADLLADGPLEPGEGTEIMAQAAEALASAHASGVAHLCLTPGSVRWTQGGGVKIVGLGVEAALAGRVADDPALADTQGLGRLLYAALTARWPGDDWPMLPPALEVEGYLRSPRQMRAGVPAEVDEITCRALSQPTHGGPPITTPASLAAALARVVPAPAPPPAMPPTVMRPPRPGPGPANPWETSGGPAAPWAGNGGRPMPRGALPSQRPGSNRMLTGVVVALVLVAIVVGAWLLSQRGPSHSTAASNHPTQQATTPVSVVLKPVSATAFGPQGGDNQDQAASAIDGKPGNGWQTDAYKGSPFFGNLYKGTGLLVDMGKPVNVESVTITFGQSPGSDVRLEMGDSNTGADNTGANPAGFTTIAKANNVSGPMTFTARAVGAHQYLLIWFTKLAPTNGGEFQADVSNITVRGTG